MLFRSTDDRIIADGMAMVARKQNPFIDMVSNEPLAPDAYERIVDGQVGFNVYDAVLDHHQRLHPSTGDIHYG